jgi:hypothetical protein
MQGLEVLQESAGTEEEKETSFRSWDWRKALKGEPQERTGLKEALKEMGTKVIERVAKP